MRRRIIVGIAFLGLFLMTVIASAASDGLLSIENKYIKIYVNNTNDDTGRFAVDVTGGDPSRSDDDGKTLIYGHPKPWTSFTTLRINGKDYCFGKATPKRSGAGLLGGQTLSPPRQEENRLSMKCQYGTVEVEQLLDIARSPSTGALDTARIRYIIVNTGTDPVEVGLRTLFDTMVGDNDGAPFRIGAKAVTKDYSCSSKEIPDFWQAFDSLATPAVIAQGTLKGGDVTPPDRLTFTNWGKAADNPWNFQVDADADFTRLGEDELDSAVVMYWDPQILKPGERRMITSYYGIGGITFSPGKTFLGISAPAEVQYSEDAPRSYTLVTYLEHHGEVKAENVKVNLSLPQGLVCSSGATSLNIPELVPGVTQQYSWEIRPNGKYQGDTTFQIKVTGEHLESNVVTRKIRIIGPPEIKGTVSFPPLKVINNNWEPYPVGVTVNIQNMGESATDDLKATFVGGNGIALAPGERNEKYLLTLEGKAETTVMWRLVPTGDMKDGSFKVILTGTGFKPVTLDARMDIPQLSAKLSFNTTDRWKVGNVVGLNLYAYNLKNPGQFKVNIQYNPAQLKLVYISRGTFLVEEGNLSEWHSGVIDNQNGRVTGIGGTRNGTLQNNEVTLFRLNFIVVGTGTGEVDVENLKVLNSNGNELHCEFTPLQYRIEEERK